MQVTLAYGKTGLPVELPDHNVTVLEPRYVAGLPDEEAAIRQALQQPIGTRPLRDLVSPTNTVAIVFSDITRPMPSDRVLPPLLAELDHVPTENIVLINGVGTHRPNTDQELRHMLGDRIVDTYRIVQHNAFDPANMAPLGKSKLGHEIWVNRTYLEADVRILTGFIEPHIFAGFSGGPKSVMPAVSGEKMILANHGADMLSNPKATWGVLEGNPVHEEIREVALRTKPTFLLNVSLNKQRAITGVFAGDLVQAHKQGTDFVRGVTMQPVPEPFDIVITSNSGYPLDLNLYQAVKGMSAAIQVVKPGGSIIIAAECWDGVPDHGNYKKFLHNAKTPQDLLDMVYALKEPVSDQWEAQLQANIQLKADVYVKNSYLSDEDLRKALFIPCARIEDTLEKLIVKYGPEATICVLPEGPQTIPYLDRGGT